jgi:hypothetical protein
LLWAFFSCCKPGSDNTDQIHQAPDTNSSQTTSGGSNKVTGDSEAILNNGTDDSNYYDKFIATDPSVTDVEANEEANADTFLTLSFKYDGRELGNWIDELLSVNRDLKTEGASIIGEIAIPTRWNFRTFLGVPNNRKDLAKGLINIIYTGKLKPRYELMYKDSLKKLGFSFDKNNRLIKLMKQPVTEELVSDPIIRAEFFAMSREKRIRKIEGVFKEIVEPRRPD